MVYAPPLISLDVQVHFIFKSVTYFTFLPDKFISMIGSNNQIKYLPLYFRFPNRRLYFLHKVRIIQFESNSLEKISNDLFQFGK